MAERLPAATEHHPVVVARGEAVREVPPELAVIQVRAESKDRGRDAVLARLTERAAAITTVLDGFGPAIERRESTGLHVHPQLKRRGEEIVAYHGTIGTRVLVTDFTVLGDLVLRLAGEELTTVDGPWWQLRPATRASGEVRQAAVADALRRAAEYAAAVGARVDRLVEISDVGAEGGFAGGAFRAMAVADEQSLDLEPQLQTVQAQVRVTVTITEPTLPI